VGIEIFNSTKYIIDSKFVSRAIEFVLARQKIKDDVCFSVVFVNEIRMRELNRSRKGIDEATDVLSFEFSNNFPHFEKNVRFIGEVFVCPGIVKDNALKSSVSFRKELAHTIIHGTLHLLGHHHEDSEKKRLAMHSIEEEIMEKLNV